jgi:hypothetical protein
MVNKDGQNSREAQFGESEFEALLTHPPNCGLFGVRSVLC